jgi:hypothetical protein
MKNEKTQVYTLMKKFGGKVNSQSNIRKVEIVKNQKPVIKTSTVSQLPTSTPKTSNTSPSNTSTTSSTPVKKKGCNCNRRKS